MKKFFFLVLFLNVLAFSHSSYDVFKKFPNKVFVETGTYVGQGVQLALDTNGFEQIISVELSQYYYEFSKNRFKHKQGIFIVKGDSSKILSNIIEKISTPITFWLDGHYSGGDTVKGSKNSPILEELDQIKNHPIKNHVILIDDVRDFGTYSFDYVTKEEIEKKIREINPSYIITYMDCPAAKNDILVAYVE